MLVPNVRILQCQENLGLLTRELASAHTHRNTETWATWIYPVMGYQMFYRTQHITSHKNHETLDGVGETGTERE